MASFRIAFPVMAFPTHRAHRDMPFIPDGLCDAPQARTPYPLSLTLVIFVTLFAVLQWAWSEARNTAIERWVIHDITVKPAAVLIQFMTPAAHARAVAASIKSPGGGLNILNGCEGTEVMFLLVAAFAAVRMGWRHRLAGIALGLVLVFVLNQVRILALFYAFRDDRHLFDLLHTTVLPALLIAAVVLYFYVCLRRDRLA